MSLLQVVRWCTRPYATSVCGLKLLVYAALSYYCLSLRRFRGVTLSAPSLLYATSVYGLKLLVYEA